MVTFGFDVYKCRGIYYVQYSRSEGHRDLGSWIVSEIPTDAEELNKWIRKKRARFSDYRGRGYVRTEAPPALSGSYEWSYMIDLDMQAFVVNGTSFFKLDSIPRGQENRDWIECMDEDAGYGQLIKRHFRHLMPDLHPDIHDLVSPTMGTYNTIVPKPRIIEPSEWTPTNNTFQARLTLTRFILKGLLEDSHAMLSTAHRYRPDDIPFQLVSMHVLSVAAPGCILTPEQDERYPPNALREFTSWEDLFHNSFTSEDHNATNDFNNTTDATESILPEDVDDYDGYSLEDELVYDEDIDMMPIPRAIPKTRQPLFHRFRNCTIVMASRLDDDDHFHAWVVLAVQKLRSGDPSTNQMDRTALLWSLRHVAVVVVSGDSVAHSHAIPFIDVFGEDRPRFNVAVDLLMHYLRPACVPLDSITNSAGTFGHGETERTGLKLPFEIIVRIMDMSSTDVHESSRFLAKPFRAEWATHPRVNGHKLLNAGPFDIHRSSLGIDNDSVRDRNIFHIYARKHDQPDAHGRQHALLRTRLVCFHPGFMSEAWATKEMFKRLCGGAFGVYTSKFDRGLPNCPYDYIAIGFSESASLCPVFIDDEKNQDGQ